MAKPTGASVITTLPRFDVRLAQIRLIGDSALICHAWSKKSKQQMIDKQTKQPKEAKAAKDPMQDYQDSLYPFHGGGYGFPTIGFKASAVDACSFVDGVTKVEARGAFHISGELLKIEGDPRPREDMVRIGMGTADIRYRGEFTQWAVNVPIRFNAAALSIDQIIHLFSIAGFAVGVGEWRPQKDGSYGMFHVARGDE